MIFRRRPRSFRSESVLERVIAKLHLEEKLSQENGRGRLSAWRNALGLPEWRSDSPREEVLRVVTKNLKVSTEPSTRLVEILYDSKDPQLAANFLNAPDHRIHPAESRVPLEDLAADGRVADPPDGRRPHQAGEV